MKRAHDCAPRYLCLDVRYGDGDGKNRKAIHIPVGVRLLLRQTPPQ